jgi:hypothetical protein
MVSVISVSVTNISVRKTSLECLLFVSLELEELARNSSKFNKWNLPLCDIEIILCDIAFVEVNDVRTHFKTFWDNRASLRPQLSGYGHGVLTVAARDSQFPPPGAPS